jgi:hypothetical protein
VKLRISQSLWTPRLGRLRAPNQTDWLSGLSATMLSYRLPPIIPGKTGKTNRERSSVAKITKTEMKSCRPSHHQVNILADVLQMRVRISHLASPSAVSHSVCQVNILADVDLVKTLRRPTRARNRPNSDIRPGVVRPGVVRQRLLLRRLRQSMNGFPQMGHLLGEKGSSPERNGKLP